jgi:choline dehydrogenase
VVNGLNNFIFDTAGEAHENTKMVKFYSLALLYVLLGPVASTASPKTYDYVVVGSGPGGGPLAANLAKAGASVLLLEAGDNKTKDLNQEIPANFAFAYSDPVQR